MKIFFTFDDGQVKNRSKYLRGALFRNGFSFVRNKPDRNFTEDIWFHGLSYIDERGIKEELLAAMIEYKGKLIFFRNDDSLNIDTDIIPEELIDKSFLFLRNHWYSDKELIHEKIRFKAGFINPILKPMNAVKGNDLKARPIKILFYGAGSGGDNLGNGRNCRIEALRLIKEAALPFLGGLIQSSVYPPPEDLAVNPIPQKEHDKLLSRSQICLALWGNNPLSYRFFEGFSRRALVVTPSLDSIEFIHLGLKPDVHYIEVKADLSDLIEKLEYYLGNINAAQEIADKGFEHFKRYFEYSGVNFPQEMFEACAASWNNLLELNRAKTFSYLIKNQILPFVKSM